MNGAGAAGRPTMLRGMSKLTYPILWLGVGLGLSGTTTALAQNGLLLGMVLSLCFRYRFWEIPIFVSAHGVIELTAIFIAGGAGLLIGKHSVAGVDCIRPHLA